MKYYVFVLLICYASFSSAQCISGDCKNGWGKMDMGYATYEGQFKNGKPDGSGTMDYGEGNKYQGEWKNGVEHGRGLLFEKNVMSGLIKSRLPSNQMAT